MFCSLVFKQENVMQFSETSCGYCGKINYNLGRAQLSAPYTGPVHLSLRANKHYHSTIETHVSDLYEILLESDKSSIIILSDGEPDDSLTRLSTLFYFRLFKNLT